MARVFIWWWFCGAALGMREEDALVPGAAGPSYHGRHTLLCWDRGPKSRSLPSAGLLGRRRKLLRMGGKHSVQAWTLATTVGSGAVQCMACPAMCWMVLDDAGWL